MTRYNLEMAYKHRKMLYEELDYVEYWAERYAADAKRFAEDKSKVEQRIIEVTEWIKQLEAEEERLDERK